MTRDEMFAYALSLPGAEDSTLHGGRCVRVRGKPVMNDTREPGAVSLSLDLETVAFLKETEPAAYYQTPHFEGWPAVLVRPAKANKERLREYIRKAWERRASKAQKALLGEPGAAPKSRPSKGRR